MAMLLGRGFLEDIMDFVILLDIDADDKLVGVLVIEESWHIEEFWHIELGLVLELDSTKLTCFAEGLDKDVELEDLIVRCSRPSASREPMPYPPPQELPSCGGWTMLIVRPASPWPLEC